MDSYRVVIGWVLGCCKVGSGSLHNRSVRSIEASFRVVICARPIEP